MSLTIGAFQYLNMAANVMPVAEFAVRPRRACAAAATVLLAEVRLDKQLTLLPLILDVESRQTALEGSRGVVVPRDRENILQIAGIEVSDV